jgi:hypothetical protein
MSNNAGSTGRLFFESLTGDYFDLGAAREIVHEYPRILGATSRMVIAIESRQGGAKRE